MSFQKISVIVDNLLHYFGYFLVISSVFILVRTFYPVASAEINYQAKKVLPQNKTLLPVNTDFSIQIPKLGVNSKVIKNVNPYNSSEYQHALTQGVAHAKGSGLPGFPGNTFIFAHSANSWYQANQYNAIFYLTEKLVAGDEIVIYYENSKYLYTVTEKKIIDGSEINYLTDSTANQRLTLMTCWPPGTTLKRLVIIAKPL